ncbi:MAG: branched-chain amino acid ABC transporter permease [Spirochaetales bacterium]|nr:branched-chain amino acid ABC transporter permease [Spirochaetales bacterium]
MRKNRIHWLRHLRKALLQGIWFVMLLFPLLVMKVNVSGGIAETGFRWIYIPVIYLATFLLAFLWNIAIQRKLERDFEKDSPAKQTGVFKKAGKWFYVTIAEKLDKQIKTILKINSRFVLYAIILAGALLYPLLGFYQTNIMVGALIYMMLALGLNIVVGLGGLLHIGQVAFFAVGAYTYGLVFKFAGPALAAAGVSGPAIFWISLPLAGITVMIFALILSITTLRLRGDYLAIVTLAFSEIIRMIIQNWSSVTGGATGISQIPRPWLLGNKLNAIQAVNYIYYIVLFFVVLTIFIVRRIEDSRIGRAWEAMREDDIACQAMGVNLLKFKVLSFVLGSFWAGLAGVFSAAQTTYISPGSFTIWESVYILMIVVIGGTGSIPGVIVGALLLKLMPEYIRFMAKYRMLLFGVLMVLMIIFKPDGFIPRKRKKHMYLEEHGALPVNVEKEETGQ